MCGRYSLTISGEELAEIFGVNKIEFSPRYNIAPGQEVPVISYIDDKKHLSMMRWGLVPSWADKVSIGYKMINARAETIDQKPSFRQSFFRRRCLIPADGYYEWEKKGKEKLPSRITLPNSEVFAFAGIWEYWEKGDIKLYTCSIITTEASESVKHIHHRMPVVLQEEMQEVWLQSNSKEQFKCLLTSYSGEIDAYRVSQKVNSAVNDEPVCIEPVN